MIILTAAQIRLWDQFTITKEPITSIDLMERAAFKCTEWIRQEQLQSGSFKIFCGKGNNGGDGLAIARMLHQYAGQLEVFILSSEKEGSADFEKNLQRLKNSGSIVIKEIGSAGDLPPISVNDIVIDALFGTGLNKAPEKFPKELILHINASKAFVISIDIPSGLFADDSSKGQEVIKASHTLTFQSLKTALLLQENADDVGEVHVLDIGLHPEFLASIKPERLLVDQAVAKQCFRPRNRFAHKGMFGHALMVAGSYGKMGAAVLATKACLAGGAGLVTCYLPACGYQIMQIAVPEAMVTTDSSEEELANLPDNIEKYSVIGIGPGIGTKDTTRHLVSFLIRRYQKPMVIDADGLNCLALQPELLMQLPGGSILTPHPKEFDRLFGNQSDDFKRMEKAIEKAKELNVVILVKGHHTIIAAPDGTCFFNSTGNAGMAKGGSGDVLTGLISALVAQHYAPLTAAILGVYLHGLSGDLAAKALSMESMLASDLIHHISAAFLQLY